MSKQDLVYCCDTCGSIMEIDDKGFYHCPLCQFINWYVDACCDSLPEGDTPFFDLRQKMQNCGGVLRQKVEICGGV